MQDAIKFIKDSLSGLYDPGEVESFTRQILSEVTGFSRTELILNKNSKISDLYRKQIEIFVNELKSFRPFQYIAGKTEFYGLSFFVNENVLIPRPETEELVEWVIQSIAKQEEQLSLLDIGTGSGCIPIAIKKTLPQVVVSACDISVGALEVASENAKTNDVDICFFQTDILAADSLDESWSVIVSNPPYIPESDKGNMHQNVLDHEPHLALFVPDEDPLRFYRAIALFGLQHLEPAGLLFFEIHYNFAAATVEMLKQIGYADVELRKDISGNDRMIKASKI